MIAVRTLLCWLLVVLSLDPAMADDETAKVRDLLRQCKGEDGKQGELYCLAYVSGVSDAMNVQGELKTQSKSTRLAMCGGAGQTYDAFVQAFVNWAEKHPEHWTKFRIYGVLMAISELWPCK